MNVAVFLLFVVIVDSTIISNETIQARTFFGQILNKVTGAYKFYALPAAQVNQPLDVPSIPVIPLPSDPGTVAQPSPFPTALPDFLTPSTGFITVADPVGSPLAQVFPGTQPQNGLTQCGCVTAGTCVTVRRASGVIDTRIVTQNPSVNCAAGQQYCCTQNTGQQQTDSCGIPNVIAGVFPTAGQANFGQFPWSGIIFNSADQYVGGAVLITQMHLLTVAHRVATYGNGVGLKIRLGDWDLSGTYEPAPFVEIPIANIAIHPSFVPATFQNDLAVITLSTSVPFLTAPSPQINSVCMPATTDVFTGAACQVAGWGQDAWQGQYQNIIKQIDLTVMGSVDCQNRLRQTKLGANWNLDTTSFICAGGEQSKDACQGDGGNALVCLQNGRYVMAGITAAGVECGHAGVPGLYVNVASYLPWISQQVGAGAPAPTPTLGMLDPRKG